MTDQTARASVAVHRPRRGRAAVTPHDGGSTAISSALIDASAWKRRGNPTVSPWFVEAIESGEIILCDPVVLELLRHVPTRDYERVEQYLRGFRQTAMTSSDWQVARQVQRELARSTAQDHRKVTIADLLIAAAAQRTGLTLVHYDDDFDRIKQVTGQPMRWLAPRGAPVTGSR